MKSPLSLSRKDVIAFVSLTVPAIVSAVPFLTSAAGESVTLRRGALLSISKYTLAGEVLFPDLSSAITYIYHEPSQSFP